MFQEYPKCLYKKGNVEAEYTVVEDESKEDEARTDGYADAYETEDAPKKRGRPAKSKE